MGLSPDDFWDKCTYNDVLNKLQHERLDFDRRCELNHLLAWDIVCCTAAREHLKEGEYLTWDKVWPDKKPRRSDRTKSDAAFRSHGLNPIDPAKVKAMCAKHNIKPPSEF